jgi:hypothetical protein
MIVVLIQEAVRNVQQLYPEDMQTLATFAPAYNDGVLPVTRAPLPKRRLGPWYSVLCQSVCPMHSPQQASQSVHLQRPTYLFR